MIYSHRNLAVRLVLDTSDCPEAVLPIQGLKSVKAIGFDPKHNFLYWVKNKLFKINMFLIFNFSFRLTVKRYRLNVQKLVEIHTTLWYRVIPICIRSIWLLTQLAG